MDPSNVGPMSHVSNPWPTLDPQAQICESVPQGGTVPLYKLSYPIYYLTQFHLLWNPISPYLTQICWHLFYYGRGPHIHNLVWRIALGPWGHPESEKSHWKQVHPGAVSLYDPFGQSLSVWLVHSTISELWACMQCAFSIWCLKFCLLVVLNQLWKPGHCVV